MIMETTKNKDEDCAPMVTNDPSKTTLAGVGILGVAVPSTGKIGVTKEIQSGSNSALKQNFIDTAKGASFLEERNVRHRRIGNK